MNTQSNTQDTQPTLKEIEVAMGAFALLAKYGTPFGVADAVLKKTSSSHSNAELINLGNKLNKEYDKHNLVLLAAEKDLKKQQELEELQMRDRFLNEYKVISDMGYFPW